MQYANCNNHLVSRTLTVVFAGTHRSILITRTELPAALSELGLPLGKRKCGRTEKFIILTAAHQQASKQIEDTIKLKVKQTKPQPRRGISIWDTKLQIFALLWYLPTIFPRVIIHFRSFDLVHVHSLRSAHHSYLEPS